ncbi:MAG: sigma-E processing peptidase SpoIIGA [Lachnospiraceae bacterium]|nr:sigma-E processing peptidase SpoIIGA [Lachnospiraceae bacterium]
MIVYLDVYFILNLILNLFLVGITALLRGRCISFRRLVAASVVTAVGSTGIYAAHFFVGKWLMIVSMAGMLLLVWMAFPVKEMRHFGNDLLTFWLVTLVTGGALTAMLHGLGQWLRGMNEKANVSMGMILFGLFGLGVVFTLLAKELVSLKQNQHYTEEAVLSHNGKTYSLRVLYDTGNQLVSPYTGERVAILAADFAQRIGVESEQTPLYIPYHSIGGSGVLPAYRLECLQTAHHGLLEHFLVAVSDELKEGQDIQMIVNIT